MGGAVAVVMVAVAMAVVAMVAVMVGVVRAEGAVVEVRVAVETEVEVRAEVTEGEVMVVVVTVVATVVAEMVAAMVARHSPHLHSIEPRAALIPRRKRTPQCCHHLQRCDTLHRDAQSHHRAGMPPTPTPARHRDHTRCSYSPAALDACTIVSHTHCTVPEPGPM